MAARPVMLRNTFSSSRRLTLRPIRTATLDQWLLKPAVLPKLVGQQRSYADPPKGDWTKDSILSSDPAVLPGSQSSSASAKTPPPPGLVNPSSASSPTPAAPATKSSVPPENVPLTPPAPPNQTQTAPPSTPQSTSRGPPDPPSSSSGPTPTPPPRKPKRRRWPYYLTGSLLIFYIGGTYYALENDNFHDIFTEFVPFGETVVGLLEEQQFRSKFPHAAHRHLMREGTRPSQDDRKVTIPSKSGLSSKVSEEDKAGSDTSQKGPHMSAVDANKPKDDGKKRSTTAEPLSAKKDEPPKDSPSKQPPKEAEKPLKQEKTPPPGPQADERPPAISTTTSIDLLELEKAEEPLVQDLVKIVNDLITVVNSDNAASKYSLPLSKAKEALAGVGAKVSELKAAEQAAAEEKIKQAHAEFEQSARELVRRIDEAREEEAQHFRHEFETEREKISHSYNERIKVELERAQQVAEQKLRNEMTEQAIELKRKFVNDVQDLVEREREGRLGKLSELLENIQGLEKLTTDWNGIIDTNLATQKLQVAVDAVRSTLENADIPRPFVKELAALKEVANGDAVVDAAIASINPTAYQRGIPTSAQLIDRFRRVAGEVRKASLLPEDAGIASHAASFVLSKILFKKQGLAVGNDVESILTRTETYLEEGNLDEAAREMTTLQGWAKTLSKDWLSDVRRVLEVKQALDIIEVEARLQCLSVE